MLGNVRKAMVPALRMAFEDGERSAQERSVAAGALAVYLSDDLDSLFPLVLAADAQQSRAFLSPLPPPCRRGRGAPARRCLAAPLPASSADGPTRFADSRRRAAAAAILIGLGRGASAWALLSRSAGGSVREYLISRLEPSGVDPLLLMNQVAGRARTVSARCVGPRSEPVPAGGSPGRAGGPVHGGAAGDLP